MCVKTAETLSLINGIDEALYFKQVLETLMGRKVTIKVFTDNHALKESIYSTKNLTERRMERSLEFIRENIQSGDVQYVKWIDTKSMLADIFTKSGVKSDALMNILKTGYLSRENYAGYVSQSCGEQLYCS